MTRLVRGELDWIVMKCLEKDRSRRYETANGFARDVQRYLADEAVEACPPSAGYRLQKFVRKHRAAFTMAATVIVLLVAGVTVSIWQAIRATQAEEEAATDRDKALKAETEAVKQAKIAKENEGKANEAAGEKDVAIKDLTYRTALDQILFAQTAFESGNVLLAHERLENVPQDLRNWEWHYLKRLYQGGIFTLYGHVNHVFAVAFSSDGTRLATGSRDKTARIWDAPVGTPLLELKGHSGFVLSVAFSPDGTRLATGSYDKTAKVWDARTGMPLFEIKGHTKPVQSAVFSPDGTRLVTVSQDMAAKVWDARTGAPLLELKGNVEGFVKAAFSPDGTSPSHRRPGEHGDNLGCPNRHTIARI